MAITLGATITNALDTTTSTLDSLHTTDANTKALVVIIKGYDSSDTDSAITSLKFGGVDLVEAEYYRNTADGDDAFIAVYYLSKPVIEEANLALVMGGSCTDLSWDAINLVSASADTIILDSTDPGSTSTTTSHTSLIDPTKTDSISVGGIVHDDRAIADLSVSTGTEISGSEVDFGSQVAGSAWSDVGSGTRTIVWDKTEAENSWACSASFYEQFYPTVALGVPEDQATGVSTTPDLTFTGTDLNSDEVEYQVQISTTPTFDPDIIEAGVGDGGVGNDDVSWSTCHSDAIGVSAEPATSVSSLVSRSNSGTSYSIARTFFPIDTSGLPAGAVIISATFSFYTVNLWQNAGGVEYCLVQTDQPSSTNLTTSDFNNCGAETGATEGASRITPVSSGNWNTFALNTTGKGWINRSGYTKLGVRTSLDVDNTTPIDTTLELDSTFATNESTNKPYITITYVLIDDFSETDAGFAGTGDPHPWPSGNEITYTVQAGDILTASTAYYWRVRAKDVVTDVWGAWSPGDSTLGYDEFETTGGEVRRVFITHN